MLPHRSSTILVGCSEIRNKATFGHGKINDFFHEALEIRNTILMILVEMPKSPRKVLKIVEMS